MSNLRDEALAAWDRGWSLTPLRGKVPLLDGWQSQPRATREHVEAWSKAGNIGLRTGAASGVIVEDEDSLTPVHDHPRTPTVRTGSGKRHYFYKYVPGIPNSVKKVHPLVDVRSDGGQVVLAGSIHPDTGEPYVWEIHPDECPLADPPAWLRASPGVTNGTASSKRSLATYIDRLRTATEGNRNDTLNKVAYAIGQRLASDGLAEQEVATLLITTAVEIGLSQSEATATARSGLAAGQRAPKGERARPRADILIPGAHVRGSGEYVEIGADDFSNAVLDMLPIGSLYRRARLPGELVGEPLEFRPIDVGRARLLVDQHVRLIRMRVPQGEGGGEPVEHFVPCTKDLASHALDGALDHPNVRQLDHLVTHPVFDEQWRISIPGHRDRTYYDEPACLRGFTPERDRGRIDAALRDLTCDFPFATEADFQTWLGCLLTPMVRPAVRGNIPLHLVTSPIERTGKTKLVGDVLGGVYLGRSVPAMQLTGSEDERDKRMLAVLMAGNRLLHLDNLNEMLDSPTLASLLTAQSYQGRVLGQSTVIEVPNYVTLVGTGNNLRVTGEIGKRTVHIQLLPSMEHPELRRDFKHPDIANYTIERRRTILEALAGMVVNWLAAGSPRGTVAFGGFDNWAAIVGGILQLHGYKQWMGDVAEWRQESDDLAADLGAMVTEWTRRPGLETATQLMELAKELGLFPWCFQKPSEKANQIAFALSVLRKSLGRVVNGYRITSQQYGNNRRYSLQNTSQAIPQETPF